PPIRANRRHFPGPLPAGVSRAPPLSLLQGDKHVARRAVNPRPPARSKLPFDTLRRRVDHPAHNNKSIPAERNPCFIPIAIGFLHWQQRCFLAAAPRPASKARPKSK